MIGIVYDGDSPLYCEERSDGYWVINGAWLLGFDGRINCHYLKEDDRHVKYEIVIPNMKGHNDYNDACSEIMRVYNLSTFEQRGMDDLERKEKLKQETKEAINELDARTLLGIAWDFKLTPNDHKTRMLDMDKIREDIINSDNMELHYAIQHHNEELGEDPFFQVHDTSF
jgi:hypothetical protein